MPDTLTASKPGSGRVNDWPRVTEWTLVPLKLAASRAVTPSVPAAATNAVPPATATRWAPPTRVVTVYAPEGVTGPDATAPVGRMLLPLPRS